MTANCFDPSVCVLAVTCDGGCWNGGECTAVNGVAKCICPSSWSGSKCQEGLFIAVSDRPFNTAGQSHQMEPQPGAQFISRSPPPPKTLNVFPGPPCLDRKQRSVFPRQQIYLSGNKWQLNLQPVNNWVTLCSKFYFSFWPEAEGTAAAILNKRINLCFAKIKTAISILSLPIIYILNVKIVWLIG